MSLNKINTNGLLDVYIYNNFITDEQCDHLVKIISARHERATIVNRNKDRKDIENVKGQAAVSTNRTNSACHFLKYDPIAMMYDAKLSKLIGVDQDASDNCQGLYYDTDQKYNCHMDAHTDAKILENSGQRTWTVITYLNTPKEGGATKFCKFDLQIEAKKGTLLMWNNLHADGSANKWSQHAGMPVISGKKYCVVKWFKEFKQNPHSYFTGEPQLKLENYPIDYLK